MKNTVLEGVLIVLKAHTGIFPGGGFNSNIGDAC